MMSKSMGRSLMLYLNYSRSDATAQRKKALRSDVAPWREKSVSCRDKRSKALQ
jgi:hypothetical protein